LVLSVGSVSGQQLGTAEEARAMLDRAISALKSNEATALSEFNDPNNKQFHERDRILLRHVRWKNHGV